MKGDIIPREQPISFMVNNLQMAPEILIAPAHRIYEASEVDSRVFVAVFLENYDSRSDFFWNNVAFPTIATVTEYHGPRDHTSKNGMHSKIPLGSAGHSTLDRRGSYILEQTPTRRDFLLCLSVKIPS